MEDSLSVAWMVAEQDERISQTIAREQSRLRNFIRGRVPDESDVEDILQEVYYELIETYRSMKSLEQVSAWLFQVARNRITDLFRQRKTVSLSRGLPDRLAEAAEGARWEDLLPSPDAGPEAAYARGILLEEFEAALAELPAEQREVFIAHEFEGRSFKELSAASGVGINTLLSRKHYAVAHLRQRLQAIHDEFRKG